VLPLSIKLPRNPAKLTKSHQAVWRRRASTELVPKQISTGDRTILGGISKRGNRYLRALFVQAAWVVLVRVGPKHRLRSPPCYL
jgi:transposase